MSRNSSVSIGTDYRLDDRVIGIRFAAGVGNFSLRHHVEAGSGPQPPPYAMGIGATSLGLKRVWHEADHSPPSSAEVKE
jgi:hypothetical protein